MDPIFASVILSFFALVVALVAIAYRESEIAKKVISGPDKLQEDEAPEAEK